MTPIKDALERIVARSAADDDADEKELRRQLWHIEDVAKEALATLTTPAPGRDALREIVRHKLEVYRVWGDANEAAKAITDAILSALPVAPLVDEAAIRADEREKCDRFIGALWTDLFNKDLVKAEGAHFFDQWRERIRAGGDER
jgi:hypothetical protein